MKKPASEPMSKYGLWLFVVIPLCTLGFASVQLPRNDAVGERELLLNPKALSARAGLETPEQMRARFADPPAEYRSMPLWVWNDELEWPRLKEQLSQFRQQGMGGVFIHPRPGLMTEYLGEEWFRLWQLSVKEGERLGLFVNIYDENSYPAGFGGGLVPSGAPDTAAHYVQAELGIAPERIPWARAETVAVFALERSATGAVHSAKRIRSRTELPPGQSAAVFLLRRASGNPWTGGFPYVDLTNPETVPVFLETTYERYKKHVGSHFGKTVRWVFDDEPLIATAGAYDSAQLALPLSFYTLAEFRKRCGYELADHLPSLYWDVGEFQKVRFDYWQTLHDLWKENYFRPLFLWCDRHNLQFTGHWMEHEWPYPWISPADASLYAYQHVPGIDMLVGENIRTQGKDPHMLFTIKQVASVAHQLGRRAFCEAYGVSGWDSTFEHYKRFGDWLMVHGINFIDQHLSFATVRGARKRDHPQSFSDVSAWWPYYRLHGDHLGRVSYMLSQGTAQNRLLVFVPTTTGFLWARRGDRTPELEKMRRDNGELMQFLADHHVDFDLGDEYLLEWFGRQDGRKLAIGRANYELVIWPKNMSNVRGQTLPLLERYLVNGGEVLALGDPASLVDGRTSDQVKKLRERYASRWRAVEGLPGLLAAVHQRLTPRIDFNGELPHGLGLSERFLPNGDRVLFFANTNLVPIQTQAVVGGRALEVWDTTSGRIGPASFESESSGRLRFPLNLPPAGSALFVVSASAAPPAGKRQMRIVRLMPENWKITPDAPNVLVLDYCDFRVAGGEEHQDTNTWRANWTIWQAHGFERPAWDNAVQFRTRTLDRNRFAPDSGFEATFRFELADAAGQNGLELAIEVSELYRVLLNGNPVNFGRATRWLDPRIKSVPVGEWTQVGENEVRIVGRPFDVRMELENLFLRGSFAVTPVEKGFRMTAPGRLNFGSWARQGYPFYGHSVLYEAEVDVPADSQRLIVDLGQWLGSVAEVLLDGKQVAALGWQPYVAEFPAAQGRRRVAVRIVSTPRNIFGPFHNPARPRMRAWPAAWADFPERQPAGAAYDVLDYGLMAPFEISAKVRS